MTSRMNMHRSTRHHQRGVNLIEIMVAMVIGLFLVLGATTLYVNTKKTSDVDDSIARLQETARYALAIIETDVRMANYWGLKKDGNDFENKNSGSGAVAGATTDNVNNASTANALETAGGSDACGAGYATNVEIYTEATNNGYALGCAENSTAVSSADTLTVRRAATAAAAASGARLQICATRKTATVVSNAATICPNGEIHNLIVSGYYVDQQSDQSNTYPSLRRKTLGTNNAGTSAAFSDVEIIPGVEDMQIELGWDNNDGLTDPAGAVRYVQPGDAVLATGRIVAVRIWLLIRAEQPDFTFTDTRTYSYADRTGTAVNDLSGAGADSAAYAPNDNFRRLLVSRTYFIRNVTGT